MGGGGEARVTVGVDLAGRTGTTGVCRVTWGRRAVVELLPARDDDDLLAAMRSADKSGIDAPLGWPVAFAELVAAHRSGAELPALAHHEACADGRPGLGNTFTHRLTDDVAWKRTGAGRRRPLSVSVDKLGVLAIRGAGLLARLAEEGRAVPRDGSGAVAEVYPAYALIMWGIASEGTYKGKGEGAEAARGRVLAALEAGLGLDLSGEARRRCVADDHALDALISAVVARAVALGLTEGLPPATSGPWPRSRGGCICPAEASAWTRCGGRPGPEPRPESRSAGRSLPAAARLPRSQVGLRVGDHSVEGVAGGGEGGELGGEVVALCGEAVEEFGRGPAVEDAGEEVADGAAGEAGGVELLDEVDAGDGGFRVVALAAGGAFGGEEGVFLVVAEGAHADVGPGGEFADAHHGSGASLASDVSVRF